MSNIRKTPKTQIPGRTPGTGRIAKKGGPAKAAGVEAPSKTQSILIVQGDLSEFELRPKEPGDPLTVQAGLQQIASRVYGYGDGGTEQLVGKLAQVALMAAEKAQLDPNLAKMLKPGVKQSLNPTGQTALSDKQLEQLAERLVKAFSEVVSSS